MTSHTAPPGTTVPGPARTPSRTATRSSLLAAARLGGAVAAADLAQSPEDAAAAYASWRRLRRGAGRQTRQLLRVAFDTGYGQAWSSARAAC